MPDLSGLMAAMGGGGGGGAGGGANPLAAMMGAMGGASAESGGATITESEDANDVDGSELYDDDDATAEGGDAAGTVEVASPEPAAASEDAATEEVSGSSDINSASSDIEKMMEEKMAANPKLRAIMEEVQTNPMAIMQHMGDPEVMELMQGETVARRKDICRPCRTRAFSRSSLCFHRSLAAAAAAAAAAATTAPCRHDGGLVWRRRGRWATESYGGYDGSNGWWGRWGRRGRRRPEPFRPMMSE